MLKGSIDKFYKQIEKRSDDKMFIGAIKALTSNILKKKFRKNKDDHPIYFKFLKIKKLFIK